MNSTLALCFLVFLAGAHCGPVAFRSENNEVTCEKEGNMRNPDNCALYYTCTMNADGSFNIYEMTCPSGLFYKEETDMCMNPVDVPECGGGDDPEPEFICSEEGYTRDPASSDCTTFYACELLPDGNWKHTEMHCPDGLAFDDVTDQCLRPEDVEGCGADDVSALRMKTKTDVTCEEEGNIRNPDDCGTYYTCKQKEDGTFIAYKMSCPVNLAYNEETDQCMYPKDVKGCEDYQPEPQPERQPQPKPESEDEDQPENEVTCEKEGNIKNPDNCALYYTCTMNADGSFNIIEMACPPGLYYKEETNMCMNPVDVPECAGNDPQPEFICSEEGYTRDPASSDCTTFYACELLPDGSWRHTEMHCPDGLAFDDVTDQCLRPEEVEGCGADDVSALRMKTKTDVTCEEEGNIRNPDDCGTYYTCKQKEDGTFIAYKMSCPVNLAYNEETDQCMYPKDVKGCEDYQPEPQPEPQPKPESEDEEQPETEVTCKEEGNIRNPDDCGTYYTCKQQADGTFITYKMSCPVNLAYNEETDQCLDAKDVKGCEDYQPEPQPEPQPQPKPESEDENQPETEVTCEEEGNIKNPDDCGTYYTCKQQADGTFITYKMSCPVNLAYNEETDQCLDAKDVKGCEDYQPEPQPEPQPE